MIVSPFLYAQKNIGGIPYSFGKELNIVNIKSNTTPEIALAKLDMQQIMTEDEYYDNSSGLQLFRYGIPVKVNLNLENSGKWLTLENGYRIWILKIYCPDATSININYDRFWIPKGAVLYIYDKNNTSFIGGFNEENNQGTHEFPSKFATGLIYDDVIFLEYFEPKEVMNESVISIADIIYGYRDVRGFGDAPCSVNINCSPEGDNWQKEKKSVAKVLMNGVGCSGSMINNTRNDGTPYFLTCNHFLTSANVNLDAINNPDASYCMFFWNYESSGCEDGDDFILPLLLVLL